MLSTSQAVGVIVGVTVFTALVVLACVYYRDLGWAGPPDIMVGSIVVVVKPHRSFVEGDLFQVMSLHQQWCRAIHVDQYQYDPTTKHLVIGMSMDPSLVHELPLSHVVIEACVYKAPE